MQRYLTHRLRKLDDLRTTIEPMLDTEQLVTTGTWEVAQILYHLASSFELSIQGRNAPAYPLWARMLIRPNRWIITRLSFPMRVPIPSTVSSEVTPPDDCDKQTEGQRLLSALSAFESFDGALSAHPVLGELSKQEWTGFHLRHSQRHLKFIARP